MIVEHGQESLADMISNALGTSRVHFVDENQHLTLADLWDQGSAIAGLDDGTIAVLLSNTSECIACLLGAIQAGSKLISLPVPGRGVDLQWYLSLLEMICQSVGARKLLVDRALIPMVPPMISLDVCAFESVLQMKGSTNTDPESFELVQFTSGSTSSPKGVHLTQRKIAANICAILERLEVGPGDGSCSWLPLSHDMGLVGMTLAPFVAGGKRWTGGTTTVVMRPESFLRAPRRWLSACSEYRSTITATPNFGLEMAIKRGGIGGDLAAIRACIVGGEPIRARTLERFCERFASNGFGPVALCPAYGLAEATLAISLTSPGKLWKTGVAALDELYSGANRPNIVSSGPPLKGYEVKIGSEGNVGEVLVRGPSLLEKYVDGSAALDDVGWFHTGDIGFLSDGELYVLGRSEDFFLIAGRKVYAVDIESQMDQLTGLRAGRSVAVGVQGEFIVFAEIERDSAISNSGLLETVRKTRVEMIRHGLPVPAQLVLVKPGRLPMTSSGKIQRSAVLEQWQEGQLDVLNEF